MDLSAPLRNALQGLAALAADPDRPRRAGDAAKRGSLPAAALSKCFQLLARAGILRARRGPGGGYQLAQPPGRVSLARVALALDATDSRRGRCLLSNEPCRERRPCALHASAARADALLARALSALTLADLLPERRSA